MADADKNTLQYLYAFTLYESHEKGKVTTAVARRAFSAALKAKGFRPTALDGTRTRRHLPQATLVGAFADDTAAVNAVKSAESETGDKHPNEFFLESAVLTAYRRVRLVGPKVVPATQPAAKAAAEKPSRATSILNQTNTKKPQG